MQIKVLPVSGHSLSIRMAVDASNSQWFIPDYQSSFYPFLFMTLLTLYFRMFSGQREARLFVVIEPEIFPSLRAVTPIALRHRSNGKLPCMLILVT